MTNNGDMSPRQPDEHHPLGHVPGDALDRVDETVAKITDAKVEEHLRRVLDESGYGDPAHWRQPASPANPAPATVTKNTPGDAEDDDPEIGDAGQHAGFREHIASAGAEDRDDRHAVTAGGPARGFWGRLPEPERELLRRAGHIRDFPPASTMCVQGDPATHLFVLVSGLVKVISVTGAGQQTVLALRGPGDVVGEVAGEVTGYRTATIEAIEAVQSIVIAYRRFAAFLDENHIAARAYRQALTQRWNDTAESLRVQSITSGAQRLARLLLTLADRYGQTNGGQTVIELPLSQLELASLVCASRTTVTRALRKWRQDRVVETSTYRITIIDRAALARIAGLRLDQPGVPVLAGHLISLSTAIAPSGCRV